MHSDVHYSYFNELMLCLYLTSTDPCFNLAVDEYLLKNRKEDFLVLSVNKPSVIIGKHQAAHREAETAYVHKKGIPVFRRISGGGAVFHDEGNLNFSFIFQSSQGKQVDFRKYTAPVIRFLGSLGIDAEFGEKNELKTDGLKISGNAEHVYRQRVLHHGTLLFSSDLDMLRNSLRKDTSGYTTRAVSSNPSHVTNLGERLPGMGMKEFTLSMVRFFLEMDNGNHETELMADEISSITALSESKYRTWEWNYAYGPEYQLNRKFVLESRGLHCQLTVKDGIICDCKIEGSQGMEAVEDALTGCRHMPADLEEAFERAGLKTVIPDIFFFF